MMASRRLIVASFALLVTLAAWGPRPAEAHPLGNFSVSRYAGIRIDADGVRLRYVLDMAEIPAFQEIQDARLDPEADHASFTDYLARKADLLAEGLRLEVDGQRLALRQESSEITFPPGAGGLPTLKLGIVYRTSFAEIPPVVVNDLSYRDTNLSTRTGWKEIVVMAGAGVRLVRSSVPNRDRSRELAEYPVDPLVNPPQDVEAHVVFTREGPRTVVAGTASPVPPAPPQSPTIDDGGAPRPEPGAAAAPASVIARDLRVAATPRSAFSEIIPGREAGAFALMLAVVLGAFHALEPGHGKTLVAAYLVGARGTARHAFLLGLIVTLSHTAGVYLLGAVTLYASRYVVAERLYPWLGMLSGLAIAVLGVSLFLRRYAVATHGDHDHHHSHGHDDHHHGSDGAVSPRALLLLGITGGIVPCPAALVVLLSAVALRRVGFGLLLIVAFSVGLAAILIGIGLLMVHARRFMARFQGEGPLISRWLPLTSAAVIAVSGVVIAMQALVNAGVVQLRF